MPQRTTSPARSTPPGSRRNACWSASESTKFLTTDDRAMVALSNGLRNVPTTESSAKSPDLKPDPKFETFVKIFSNPHTTTTPVTAAGSACQELFNGFVDKWQAGRVDDLQAGLDDIDKQIDAQLANVEGGQDVP